MSFLGGPMSCDRGQYAHEASPQWNSIHSVSRKRGRVFSDLRIPFCLHVWRAWDRHRILCSGAFNDCSVSCVLEADNCNRPSSGVWRFPKDYAASVCGRVVLDPFLMSRRSGPSALKPGIRTLSGGQLVSAAHFSKKLSTHGLSKFAPSRER